MNHSLPVQLFLILSLAGCANGGRSAVIPDAWIWQRHASAYQTRATHKSLAVAPGQGISALGYSSGYDSQTAAVQRALAECEEAVSNAESLFGRTPGAPCATYSVDDLVVWKFADFSVSDPQICMALPHAQAYARALQRQIERKWRPFETRPNDAARLELTLNRRGEIERLRTLEATSDDVRSEAEAAVRAAGPYWPLFGELGCLAGVPIRLQFGEPKAAA